MNENGPGINADCLIGWHELSVADFVVQSSLHLINNDFDYSNNNQIIVGNMVTKEERGGGDEFVRIVRFRDALTNAFAVGGSFTLVEGQQKAQLRIVAIHGGDFTLTKELFLIKID